MLLLLLNSQLPNFFNWCRTCSSGFWCGLVRSGCLLDPASQFCARARGELELFTDPPILGAVVDNVAMTQGDPGTAAIHLCTMQIQKRLRELVSHA